MLLFFQWSLFFMKIMILSVPKQHYNNMIITHLLPTITIVRLNFLSFYWVLTGGVENQEMLKISATTTDSLLNCQT